jgi:hypothetical protein
MCIHCELQSHRNDSGPLENNKGTNKCAMGDRKMNIATKQKKKEKKEKKERKRK